MLDDAPWLRRLLRDLRVVATRAAGADAIGRRLAGSGDTFAAEIIVIDGGSGDDSVAVAKDAGVRVLERDRGRGLQLDEGARAASGTWLWFLHADSRVSREALEAMIGLCGSAPGWGRFDVGLAHTPLLRLIATAMNWRSAITGICTGDQGIFVHRALLESVGGVPRQPLMEDIELSKRLRRLRHPLRIRTPIQTSARRWRERGVLKTMFIMWWLRFRYLCGAEADELDRRYYG